MLRLAAVFLEAGIRPGCRVGVLLTNKPEVVETTLAANAIGAIAVPINFRLAAPEVAYIIQDTQPQMLAVAAKLLPRDRVAKIAILEGAPGMPQNWQRTKGFKEGLEKAGIEYEIVASQPTNLTPEQGQAVCQNIITAHPDVDLIYNQADDLVIGCAKAVREADSHAKLVGWGGSRLGIAAIKAGDVDGTVCVQPEKMGELAFKALYAKVTNPNTPKAQFIEVDTPEVTKANVASCVPQW